MEADSQSPKPEQVQAGKDRPASKLQERKKEFDLLTPAAKIAIGVSNIRFAGMCLAVPEPFLTNALGAVVFTSGLVLVVDGVHDYIRDHRKALRYEAKLQKEAALNSQPIKGLSPEELRQKNMDQNASRQQILDAAGFRYFFISKSC